MLLQLRKKLRPSSETIEQLDTLTAGMHGPAAEVVSRPGVLIGLQAAGDRRAAHVWLSAGAVHWAVPNWADICTAHSVSKCMYSCWGNEDTCKALPLMHLPEACLAIQHQVVG